MNVSAAGSPGYVPAPSAPAAATPTRDVMLALLAARPSAAQAASMAARNVTEVGPITSVDTYA
jgi:hypothetical protein